MTFDRFTTLEHRVIRSRRRNIFREILMLYEKARAIKSLNDRWRKRAGEAELSLQHRGLKKT